MQGGEEAKLAVCSTMEPIALAPLMGEEYPSSMAKEASKPGDTERGKALLKRELQKGLDSGVSKRTPAQIHAAIRKAREAA